MSHIIKLIGSRDNEYTVSGIRALRVFMGLVITAIDRAIEVDQKHDFITIPNVVGERSSKWAPSTWVGMVTGGGVALSEIHPSTMESRRCAGLHLCGEILDAFGPIGGHNFLWAWATGRAAGTHAAAAVRK